MSVIILKTYNYFFLSLNTFIPNIINQLRKFFYKWSNVCDYNLVLASKIHFSMSVLFPNPLVFSPAAFNESTFAVLFRLCLRFVTLLIDVYANMSFMIAFQK